MAKVYLISSGSYSDYSVHAAFTTREAAEKMLPLYNRSSMDDSFIEERDLDPEFPEFTRDGMRPYVCRVVLDSGEISQVYQAYLEDFRVGAGPIADVKKAENGKWERYPALRVTAWARDKEHMAKIAADKRREYIANQQEAGQ